MRTEKREFPSVVESWEVASPIFSERTKCLVDTSSYSILHTNSYPTRFKILRVLLFSPCWCGSDLRGDVVLVISTLRREGLSLGLFDSESRVVGRVLVFPEG